MGWSELPKLAPISVAISVALTALYAIIYFAVAGD
jgi:hypothetical protein